MKQKEIQGVIDSHYGRILHHFANNDVDTESIALLFSDTLIVRDKMTDEMFRTNMRVKQEPWLLHFDERQNVRAFCDKLGIEIGPFNEASLPVVLIGESCVGEGHLQWASKN